MSAFKISLLVVLVVIASVSIVIFLFRRRSGLPSHLKPYFKNAAALDISVREFRESRDKRREELTDPSNAREAAEYLSLNGYDAADLTFEKALQMVESHLRDNPCDYGQLLGEMYAFSMAYRNPEKAYYYYYVGLSQDGYSVGFRDENHDPPYYCGPNGDFRNESQVSELVIELGWEEIEQIDRKARGWLIQNGFTVQDFHQ